MQKEKKRLLSTGLGLVVPSTVLLVIHKKYTLNHRNLVGISSMRKKQTPIQTVFSFDEGIGGADEVDGSVSEKFWNDISQETCPTERFFPRG